MYFVEIFQAFTGRLPEVDDLIANTYINALIFLSFASPVIRLITT